MKRAPLILILLLAIFPAADGLHAQSRVHDLPLPFREGPDNIRIAESGYAAPADVVWSVLPSVLADLGIEPQVDTTMAGVIGNIRIDEPVVGGERARHYVSCGSDVGPGLANMYRIRLSLMVHVRPEGEGTRTFTRVVGAGRTVHGSGSDAVLCLTTGKLEQRIAEGINNYLTAFATLGQATEAAPAP